MMNQGSHVDDVVEKMQKLELKALLPLSSLHHCPQYDDSPLQEYDYCKDDLADVQRRKYWWRESWKYLHISAQSQMQILHLGMQIPGCRPEFFTFKCKYSCAGGGHCTGQREISFSGNTHVGSASADTFLILHIFEKNSRTRILYNFSTKKSQLSMLKPKTVICGSLRGVRKV